MEITAAEDAIRKGAIDFARSNKKRLCRELTDPAIFMPEERPVAVFMAGSPGAGKTESSKELIAEFERDGHRVLRIDPDELRCHFPNYDGRNSSLFQPAVSILVDRMLDLAHEQRQSFLLDGTLSDYDRAHKNVLRCLKKGRTVQILYVYQDPRLAWEFVQAREREDGRRIPLESFIEQYFAARTVVNALKVQFGPDVAVDLLVKPHDQSTKLFKAGIDKIDYHVPEKYTADDLRQLLVMNAET